MSMDGRGIRSQSATLVDILDRILDKGLVVAGDVRITLANVELITIKIRLLICSIDKAEQIGLNWWRYDSELSGGGKGQLDAGEVERLEKRIAHLERELTEKKSKG